MKRLDLIHAVSIAARDAGLLWVLLRQGASHEIWDLDGLRVTVPRHREIDDRTAGRIMRLLEDKLGAGVVAMTTRKTYTALAERGGGWWAVTVPELRGVFTQARRLANVEPMARDAIALFLDIEMDAFDIDVREVLDPAVDALVAEAIQARSDALEHQRIAAAKSREAVTTLDRLGLPQRDIGRLLNLSHQRVAQLLAPAGDRPQSH